MQNTRERLEQLALLLLSLLLVLSCLLILRPFISAILWALILALATWPAFNWLNHRLKGRRALASLLLSLSFVIAIIAPLALVTWNFADSASGLVTSVRSSLDEGMPEAPEWLTKVPYVGPHLTKRWGEIFGSSASVIETSKRLLTPAMDFVVVVSSFLGQTLLQFILSIFILFFIYRDGEVFLARLQVGAYKIIGERGRALIAVATNTLRSAIYGIVGTAAAQSLLAGIGFLIAGVPGVVLLTALTFVLSPIPAGPPLLWIGGSIWLFRQDANGMGIFLLVWGAVVVSSVDNFLKPYIMSRGSNMPLVLILLGILGGALAFGALGIFLGPALLAVGYTVLKEWSETGRPQAAAEARVE
jgi:predicted PurR-regulated permease PerM